MKATVLRDLLLLSALPLLTVFAVAWRPGTVGHLPGAVPAPTAAPSAAPRPTTTLAPTATRASSPTARATTTATAAPRPTPTPAPSALDAWVFVPLTKDLSVPKEYAPADLVWLDEFGIPTLQDARRRLRIQAAAALAEIFDAARQEGHTLVVCSAYRSYADQVVTFDHWVADEMAKAESAGSPISREEAERRANQFSALPGHSEHQLGTAVDVSSPEVAFDLVVGLADTPPGRWLAENSYRFGYVFSYPAGKENLTGYVAEPWHLRWIGRTHALELQRLGYLDPSTPVTVAGYLIQLTAPTEKP